MKRRSSKWHKQIARFGLPRFFALLAANLIALTFLGSVMPASAQPSVQDSGYALDYSGINIHDLSLVSETAIMGLIPKIAQTLWHIDFTNSSGGCEAKAHEIAYFLQRMGINSGKIFIEGSGLLNPGWSFHVAVVVKVARASGNDLMVIDPALFPFPVNLGQWISQVSSNNTRRSFGYLATQFTYLPRSHGGTVQTKFRMKDLADACLFNVQQNPGSRRRLGLPPYC